MDKQTKVKQASSEKSDKVQFVATARYIRYSPYKLRPIADVIRGKDVVYALNWLTTYRTQRVEPIKKVLESAVANAKNLQNVETSALAIKEIRIDQGPIHRYFKPGAMGRAMVQRKRMSHLSVILEPKN
jgi:large subunit ribosomal protein L22